MISAISYDYQGSNLVHFDFCGLSTDEKPVQKYDCRQIDNGSSFLEMDTGSIYFYDMESGEWMKFGG